MAKIEPWEQRTRDEMAEFASQLNKAPGLALTWQESAHRQDSEHVPSLDPKDPKWIDKATKPAHDLLIVAASCKLVIRCEEEEDLKQRGKAMERITQFTEGLLVRIEWRWSNGQWYLTKVLETPETTHPIGVAYLVFALDEYLNRYRELIHLGVCRTCGKAYLKPKHGKKMRYCSNSCRQKAYRKRQERGGAKEMKAWF